MPGLAYSPSAIRAMYPILEKHEPSTRRGGIYANKGGYHDTRNGNSRSDYSVQCPADRDGDPNAAAAIDITLSDAAMKRVTKRLFDACRNNDPRIECVREVIGTLDGRNVAVYNRVSTGIGSRSRTGNIGAASDSSHLWHVHISFLRRYVNDRDLMLGVAEVAAGLKPGTLTKSKPAEPPKPAPKPSKPKRNWVTRYAGEDGANGYHAGRSPSPVKHRRKAGFRIRGYWVTRSDGKYLRTAYGTDYPADSITATKPKGPKRHTLWLVRDTYWYDGTGRRRAKVKAGTKLSGYIDKKKFKDGRYLRCGSVPHRRWFPLDSRNFSHQKGGKSLQDD